MLLVALLACSTPTPPAEPPKGVPISTPASADAAAVAAAAERGKGAIKTLGATLKAELLATMSAEGPVAAIAVCHEKAPKLAAKAAEDAGVRLGRSSTRVRNPKNAPSPWVAEWLAANDGRPASEVTGTVAVADGVVRVIQPIGVEAPCLACHGSDLAPEVAAALAERYPEDTARGYAVGDLRGAFWAEVPID